MSKFSHIYMLIALIPLLIVILVVYTSLSADIYSPIMFSNISKTVEGIINTASNSEPTPEGKSIKIGSTEDPKALGYTGQDKIAINSKGEIFATYRSKDEGDYEIYVSKIKNGTLEFEKRITDSGEDKTQRVPSIAIDEKDVIHITWYGLTSNEDEGRQIKYTQSRDGGKTWSDPIIPSLVEGYEGDDYWQEHPQILAQGTSLYIVWEGKDSDHEEQQIKFTKSEDNGKSWIQWINLKPNPDNTQSRPYLILDSNNSLNLFMYSSRESDNQQIWHSISSDEGANWGDWRKVSEGLGDSRHASATISGNKLFAVWRSESDNGKSQIYFSKFEQNNWSAPELVMQSNTYQFFPVAGSNSEGEIIVTWVESNDQSEFPRDDPQDAKGYYAIYNESSKIFENKILLGENIFYPHVVQNNSADNNFYLVFQQGENKNFEIKLLTIN